jgi:hypothetical protein
MINVCSCCNDLLHGTRRRLAQKGRKARYFQPLKHHQNIFNLISAAENGCSFCKFLPGTFSALELKTLCSHKDWTKEDRDELESGDFVISYKFPESNRATFRFGASRGKGRNYFGTTVYGDTLRLCKSKSTLV